MQHDSKVLPGQYETTNASAFTFTRFDICPIDPVVINDLRWPESLAAEGVLVGCFPIGLSEAPTTLHGSRAGTGPPLWSRILNRSTLTAAR